MATSSAKPTAGAAVSAASIQDLTGPDPLGRFGSFGGRFVPETLMDALDQLARPTKKPRPTRGFNRGWTTT